MITVALCSLVYRSEPIEKLIPKIAECGFDAVEIFGSQLDGKSDAELASIRKTAEANQLGIVAISPYFSFTRTVQGYDESIATAKRFFHYGEMLNCRRIRTFTDVGPSGISSAAATPEQWQQGIRGLKEITALAPGYEFLMETHPLTLADTMESTQRVLREVAAPNLKIIYQPTTDDFVKKGIVECWRILRPHVAHMHLQNRGEGNEHGWLDRGTLDLAGFLGTVRADGYAGTMSVEYHWKDTPWERVREAYQFMAKALGRAGRA